MHQFKQTNPRNCKTIKNSVVQSKVKSIKLKYYDVKISGRCSGYQKIIFVWYFIRRLLNYWFCARTKDLCNSLNHFHRMSEGQKIELSELLHLGLITNSRFSPSFISIISDPPCPRFSSFIPIWPPSHPLYPQTTNRYHKRFF